MDHSSGADQGSPEIIAAVIALAGVLAGLVFSFLQNIRASKDREISMLVDAMHGLAGEPRQIIASASVAVKYHKSNRRYRDLIMPILIASSLKLTYKERSGARLSDEERYALYIIWRTIGSVYGRWARSEEHSLEKYYPEYGMAEQHFLASSVGQYVGRLAMTKYFGWLSEEVCSAFE